MAVDLALIRRLAPLGRALGSFLSVDVRGMDRVPRGACLLVGNQSGGADSPDPVLLATAFYTSTGFTRPLYFLGHDVLFRLDPKDWFLSRLGVVRARRACALRLLGEGHAVVVYPGGDWEANRPSREKDRIDFHDRTGFLAVARAARVPLVPVVTAGTHQGFYVLTRGERLARWLSLHARLRLDTFPVAVGLPTGILLGPLAVHGFRRRPAIVEVLAPERPVADDDEAYRRITGRMQRTLTALSRELSAR